MQNLSFDFHDPLFEFNGLRFGVQVFTFENVYGLDRDSCTVAKGDSGITVSCSRLTLAGGQETAQGSVSVRAEAGEHGTTFRLEASCDKTIRCVKLLLEGMPRGVIRNLRETQHQEVPAEGLLLRYPDGWRALYTPLIIMEAGNQYLYFRSLDTRVREKRFTFLPRGDRLDVELIFEELTTEMGTRVSAPAWEVGTSQSMEDILKEQTEHVERAYGLAPWEQRTDVPNWAREISLVATIHCRHFTGYVFNDYARVLDTIEWLAERIEPERILAYLPGWEGRYYWQYGEYRPDPRMGGKQGFERLVSGARSLGVHVMPMFGINVVNRDIENFPQWGAPAIASTAAGISGGVTVDWDSSRHHDHGWAALLNPGAPTWQNRLVGQIRTLVERYGFEAVFLDISAGWMNDPKHNVYEGAVRMAERIREGRPEVLVAGEGWYDAVGRATPLMQCAVDRDYSLHWHDQPYAPLFDTYNRSFLHLCVGDPGRGSTGVHELGYNEFVRSPVRKGNIPTVAIVEDTLEKAPEKVLEVIEDARAYASRYLTGTLGSA